jgi:hypothetical protein
MKVAIPFGCQVAEDESLANFDRTTDTAKASGMRAS